MTEKEKAIIEYVKFILKHDGIGAVEIDGQIYIVRVKIPSPSELVEYHRKYNDLKRYVETERTKRKLHSSKVK